MMTRKEFKAYCSDKAELEALSEEYSKKMQLANDRFQSCMNNK